MTSTLHVHVPVMPRMSAVTRDMQGYRHSEYCFKALKALGGRPEIHTREHSRALAIHLGREAEAQEDESISRMHSQSRQNPLPVAQGGRRDWVQGGTRPSAPLPSQKAPAPPVKVWGAADRTKGLFPVPSSCTSLSPCALSAPGKHSQLASPSSAYSHTALSAWTALVSVKPLNP